MRYLQTQSGLLVPDLRVRRLEYRSSRRQRGFLRSSMAFWGSVSIAPASTTWNPYDYSTNCLVLSNGNLTIGPKIGGGNAGFARATTSHSAGKWYYEIHMDNAGVSNFGQIGLLSSTAINNDQSIGAAGGWGYYEQTGNKVHAGSSFTFGAIFTTGDVIGIAWDADAGNVWWAKNNVWQASGNPSSGTNAAFSSVTGPLFAAVSGYGVNGPTITGRFKTADFSYIPPSGFSAWGT